MSNRATRSWASRVPREYAANLRCRKFLLGKAKADPRVREAIVAACRQDVLFFINAFVWQYNPRQKGREIGPFITWDFQEKGIAAHGGLVWCIENDSDVLVEKSREMGASWVCLIILLWFWLFRPWQKFLCISRNADAVDRPADPDSLFWKLDHVLNNLPDWLLLGYDSARHRVKFTLSHPNGSNITGQASTGKAGVGGRATACLLDEFSQVDEDYEVLSRTSDTSGCRIFAGTHRGTSGAFYELSQRVDLRRILWHWSSHPHKNRGLYRYNLVTQQVELLDKSFVHAPDFDFVTDGSPTGGPHPGVRSPWYDEQCKRKASLRAIAEDLDVNPKGSQSSFFNPIAIRGLIHQHCSPPWWEGDVSYHANNPRETGQLIRVPGGPLKLWCHLDLNGRPYLGRYAAGADVAAGTGATASCLAVADAGARRKVLEYQNPHVTPEKFAAIAVAVCALFRDGFDGALFAWEQQGPGVVFGKRVLEFGYRNVYWQVNEKAHHPAVKADRAGWVATPDNKRTLLEEYRAAIATQEFVNPSDGAMEECLSFRYTPRGTVEHAGELSANDPSGARVNHGDQTIADALCYKMMRTLATPPDVRRAEEIAPGSLAWRRIVNDNHAKASSDGWA